MGEPARTPRGDGGYLKPYRQAVEQFGPGFKALLWNNPDTQRTRFRVISEMVDLNGRVAADIGCGNADLLAYLVEQGITPASYVGVDGVPEMIELCERDKLPEPSATFHVGDFVADPALFDRLVRDDRAEVFVFSGSLNTLSQGRAARVLDRAWRAINAAGGGAGGGDGGGGDGGEERGGKGRGGGLVFNFLSTAGRRRGEELGPAKRFEPARFLDWALARSPNVRFRQGYLGAHDATIAMWTQGNR